MVRYCGGTSLLVQWLRLCAPNAGTGFDPLLGNYIPHATTKTQHSQIHRQILKKNTVETQRREHVSLPVETKEDFGGEKGIFARVLKGQ